MTESERIEKFGHMVLLSSIQFAGIPSIKNATFLYGSNDELNFTDIIFEQYPSHAWYSIQSY